MKKISICNTVPQVPVILLLAKPQPRSHKLYPVGEIQGFPTGMAADTSHKQCLCQQ